MIFFALSLSGCGGAAAPADETTDSVTTIAETAAETTVAQTVDYSERMLDFGNADAVYKTYGRTERTADGLNCDFSMSGAELEINCRGRVSVTLSATRSTFIALFFDGETVNPRAVIPSGTSEFVLSEAAAEGVRTVKILKTSSPETGKSLIGVTLKSLNFTGEAADRPVDSETYIEFFGDSITCGSGCLGKAGEPSTPGVEDGMYSYAYLTAKALSADYSITAVGGMGLVRSYGSREPLSSLYEYTSWYRNNEAKFDFERKEDIVVVNIGTNDAGEKVSESEYEAALEAFIVNVREKHDNPKVVVVYGIMSSAYAKQMLNVTEKLGGEKAGIYFLKLPSGKSGAGNHPDTAQQQAAADVLTEFLRTIIDK